jgi:hypothetical protein
MSHQEAKQKRKETRENPLNDPSKWSTEPRPPYFARDLFQARLDMRAGTNQEGKSILRLRWAPEVFTEMFDERLPRYWVSRVKNGESWLYTCVPRWVIEKRIEKGQYADSWNKNRQMRDPASPPMCYDCGYKGDSGWDERPDQKLACKFCGGTDVGGSRFIDKGPPPEDFYVFTWLCAEHEGFLQNGQPACCERAWQDGRKRCWGTFRSPNDYDLICVEAAVRRREGEPYIDPYAPLSQADLEMIESSSCIQQERAAMEAEMRAQEVLRDQRIFSDTNTVPFDMGRQKPLIITPN